MNLQGLAVSPGCTFEDEPENTFLDVPVEAPQRHDAAHDVSHSTISHYPYPILIQLDCIYIQHQIPHYP